MTINEQAQVRLAQWWNTLKRYSGMPAQGTLAGALVALERLQVKYSLDISAHTTRDGTQISGQTGASVAKILRRYGEKRRFLSEGGRTSRGTPPSVSELLRMLEPLHLDLLPENERNEILCELQIWLVARVSDYFNREHVKFDFNGDESAYQTVHNLLAAARAVGKEGQVAQYLVGAKLALRFPDLDVRNDCYSTSDVQSGHPGDFLLRNVVFHVTIAPNAGHYAKCQDNARQGYRVYLLVPERILLGTRQNLDEPLARRVDVRSIESFVSQNIDELTIESAEGPVSGFKRLLKTYNERVDAVESDKSLLIDIPHNLQD